MLLPKLRVAGSLLLALALMFVYSCGAVDAPGAESSKPLVTGTAASPRRSTPAAQPISTSPLQLPAPASLIKQNGSSFTLADGYSDGADFAAALPNNRVSAAGSSAAFAPAYDSGEPLSELSYAVYSFTLPDYNNDAPVDIKLNWSDAPDTGKCFVCLSEFFDGYWETFALPADGRLPFAGFTEYISQSDIHLLTVVVTGTDAAILDSIQLTVAQPPVASIVPDKDSGVVPLTVNFDASASMDPDGSIVSYEWDLDGDGLFNENGSEADAMDSVAAVNTYSAFGTFTVTLRVTDDGDFQDEATVEINVSESEPPVADLKASQESGPKVLEVDLNAGDSMDPDGTIVDFEWDFDGDNNFNEADNGESAAQGNSLAQASYAAVGDFNATVRVTDNDGGKDTASVVIMVTNTPPIADIQASALEGDAPFQVDFNAEGSFDPAGNIVETEWDFDGDGLFNEAGTEEETAHDVSQPNDIDYLSPGVFNATLRVTDEDGASDTASVGITAHGWIITTVDQDVNSQEGYSVDLLVQNGKPVIGHSTLSPYGIRWVSCSTQEGTTQGDWTGATVLDGTLAPGLASFALIGGNPAVSFFSDTGTNGLFYSRSSTAGGTNPVDWISPVLIDNANLAGLTSDLLEVSGKPSIAYSANTTGDLRYARSTQNDGSSGWSSFTIDGDGAGAEQYGGHLSLNIVSGAPAVAYSSASGTQGLFYIKSSTATGAAQADWTGGVHTTILADTSACQFPSLAIVNGFPAVSFMDASLTLRFARSSSATGSAAWSTAVVDNTGITGEHSSLAIIGGFPAIAYHSQSADHSRFVSSTDMDGAGNASWTNEADIQPAGSNGRFTSLVELASGRAAVAYRDDGNALLKYAVKY